MRDPDLERYVGAIEDQLARRRGRDHCLSPPDFALARRWHAGGVPVADVIAAIDAVAADGGDLTSLAPCRRRVEAKASRAPRPAPPASEAPAVRDAERRIQAIAAALDGLDDPRAARFSGTRAALAALREGRELDGAGLEQLERTLAREAVAALEPAARARIEERLERGAARQRGRVTAAVLEQARRSHLETAALRALGLPPA